MGGVIWSLAEAFVGMDLTTALRALEAIDEGTAF